MLIYVATTNPGKLRDFAFAAELARRCRDPAAAGACFHSRPAGGRADFEGNARAKAIYYSLHAPHLYVLADDSGLEVTCLDGAPGVRSARYADDQRFPPRPVLPSTSATTPRCFVRWTAFPNPAARGATAARSRWPAMERCLLPRTARSKAASSPRRRANAGSATIRSSSSPNSTRPWPNWKPEDRLFRQPSRTRSPQPAGPPAAESEQ